MKPALPAFLLPPSQRTAVTVRRRAARAVVRGLQAVVPGLVLATLVGAQQWVAGRALPVASYQQSMAFDEQRGVVVHYGGPTSLDRLMTYDGAAWRTLTPAFRPVGRHGAAMAYDRARARIVMFGGVDAQSAYRGDTWEWDGQQWFQPPVSSAPEPRHWSTMVFDSVRGHVLLYGGASQTVTGGLVMHPDLWAWDGVAWQRLPAAHQPPVRRQHAMAFDEQRGRAVLFAGSGQSQGGYLADTWEWDGADWRQVATIGAIPSARLYHRLAYDGVSRQVVLFGGWVASGVPTNETWSYDGVGWTRLTFATSPGARSNHGFVYDRRRERLVVAGGSLVGSSTLQTWELVLSTASASAYGAGCAGMDLAPLAGDTPVLGTTFSSRVSGFPAGGVNDLVWMGIGSSAHLFAGVPLPMPLDAFGGPGCLLHHDVAFGYLHACAPEPAGTMRHDLAVPADPLLLGRHLYLQAWTTAAQGIASSNGLRLRFGSQ